MQQSKALIRIFRAMKDYIADTQRPVFQRDVLRLSMQTMENTEAIRNLQSAMNDQQNRRRVPENPSYCFHSWLFW